MFHLLVINGEATHTESELVSPGTGLSVPAPSVFSLCDREEQMISLILILHIRTALKIKHFEVKFMFAVL